MEYRMNDPLGDIVKVFERAAETVPSGDVPVIVRLDGKNFSKWTKRVGCVKPFDERLTGVMVRVTEALVKFTDADIGYTQSDEITLILTKKHETHEIIFGGRYQKLCSVLASKATVVFNEQWPTDDLAMFDCRVFEAPWDVAVKALEWRAEDCRRNSVSVVAQSNFSHKELQGKKTWEMKEMLKDIGKDWHDLPCDKKNGTYIKRVKTTRVLTEEELQELPEKHHARLNPDIEIERTKLVRSSDSITYAENKERFIWNSTNSSESTS
jgi:tRNA(His) 5'-end guanylyltransferase